MFKRLNELEHSAYRARSTPHLTKSMLELQGLIHETFGEITGQDLCDLFVQPTLRIADPNGLMTSALAALEEKPEIDLLFEVYLNLLREAKPAHPILVLGNVGIGKSTLLRSSFECSLKDEPIFPIFIDFKNANDDPEKISNFVANEIDRALTEKLQSDRDAAVSYDVFAFCQPARKTQLENLTRYDEAAGKKAEWDALELLRQNKEDWNLARIRYLQEKSSISVCLIFDNVDHHWTPKFIQSVIMEAMFQSGNNRCQLFITLRPYNYGVAYERGVYAAHPFTVIRLSEPGIQLVLERRVEATLRKYDSRDFSTFKLHNNMGVSAPDYLQLLKMKLNSLISTPVKNLLGGIAGTNFRKLLLCVRYIFSLKTLSANIDPLRSTLTEYDALECILRPNGPYYESPEMNSEAVVVNVFENESPGQPGNNLIRIRALQAVDRYGNRGAPHRAVLEDMSRLGYPQERVKSVLDTLHNFGLIEPGDNSDVMWSIDPTPYSHQLTFSGRYYLEHLIYEYRYARAIKEATSFPEEQFQAIVGSSVEIERSLEQRVAEIEAFDEYIAGEEEAEERRCSDASLLQAPFYRIVERMKSEHNEALTRLRSAYTKRSHEHVTTNETSQPNQQGD